MSVTNYEGLTRVIVDWVRSKMEEANTGKLEVDISGGIDSAVTAALAVRAAGANHVIGVYSACHSRDQAAVLARQVAQCIGIRLVEIDFESMFNDIVTGTANAFKKLGLDFPDRDADKLVFGSLRSTLRAPIGRFVNRAFGGGLRVGTGNRDEDELVRFYQKGGDGEVDLNPIAGLYKSEVWALAAYLGLPDAVIEATPTPDLWGNGMEHTDENELAQISGVELSYTRPGKTMGSIEWVSRENAKHGVINGDAAAVEPEQLAQQYRYNERQTAVIAAVRKLEKQTRHKASPPPLLQRERLESMGLVQ